MATPLVYTILSNPLSWLMQRTGYRRLVIRRNWEHAGIQATPALLRSFYRGLGDIIIESLLNMRRRKARALHIVEVDTNDLDLIRNSNGKILLMAGHLGNWECFSALFPHLPDGWLASGVYKPLSNKRADRMMRASRGRLGIDLVPMEDVGRYLVKHRHTPTITLMVADQYPAGGGQKKNVPFLGHDTPFFSGAERLVAALGLIPVYGRCIRTSRGHYRISLTPLDPEDTTASYARELEKDIYHYPDQYLWSHKRFKHLPHFYTPQTHKRINA